MIGIGVSTLCMLDSPLELVLETISDFSHVEIICEGHHTDLSILESYDFTVSFHAPFSDLNTASLNKEILKESLKQISENIEEAHRYNAEAVCIHPGHYSPLSIHFKEKARGIHIESLKMLAEKAEEYSVHLGIENMPYFPILCGRTPEEIEEILDQVDSDYLGFTFDVGHAHITGNDENFLHLRDRITVAHLHDNQGDSDTHLALGEGTVDSNIIKQIASNRLVIEVYTYADATKSLEYLKNLF